MAPGYIINPAYITMIAMTIFPTNETPNNIYPMLLGVHAEPYLSPVKEKKYPFNIFQYIWKISSINGLAMYIAEAQYFTGIRTLATFIPPLWISGEAVAVSKGSSILMSPVE